MSFAAKFALLPLIVLWLWVLPRSQTEVVGAEAEAAVVLDDQSTAAESLADAFDTRIEPIDIGSTTTTTTTTTTNLIESATEAGEADAGQVIAPRPLASIPVPSTVTTTVPPAETLPIGQLALDRLSIDWQAMFPTWRIEFTGPREGLRALTYPRERIIELFVRADDTPETLHRVLAHELGHVIDVELNNDEDRARWVQQRGLASDVPWWPSAAAPDFATGAGDFAEAFAVMESGVVSRSTVGSQPTAADLVLLRELMQG